MRSVRSISNKRGLMGLTDLRDPVGTISLSGPRRPRRQLATGEHCHVARVSSWMFRRVVRRVAGRVVGCVVGRAFDCVVGRVGSPGRMSSAVTKSAPLMLPRTRRQPPASRLWG